MDAKNDFVVILAVMFLMAFIYNRGGFEIAVLFCLSAILSALILISISIRNKNK